MRYLLYNKDGLDKKFPLDKSIIKIGRSETNDIIINDSSISKEHCQVEVSQNNIKVIDLGSHNGTYIENTAIMTKRLSLEESFAIGNYRFTYRKGEVEEFTIDQDLFRPINSVQAHSENRWQTEVATEESRTKYDVLLENIIDKSSSTRDFDHFIKEMTLNISSLINHGSLILIKEQMSYTIFNHLKLDKAMEKKLIYTSISPISVSYGQTQMRCFFFKSQSTQENLYLAYIASEKTAILSDALSNFLQRFLNLIEYKLNILSQPFFTFQSDSILFQGKNLFIIGNSQPIRNIVKLAQKIAPKIQPVLILGESGTGKELIARLIHQSSTRNEYVGINCAAIPANLLESELFGYEKGAFTGADKQKKGKLEVASGGTLVLDEITEMPLEIQSKLLRVLQEKVLYRLGSNQPISVDFRIIAITNQNIYQMVEEKKFREDLFYRLRVHEFAIPPLRERKEDIPPLIRFFTNFYVYMNRVKPRGYSQSASNILLGYDWPGNIRELENEIARILEIVEEDELISVHHILPSLVGVHMENPGQQNKSKFKVGLEQVEREKIIELLRQKGGNKMKTAQEMGMSYRGFLKKLKRLNIN